MTYRKWGRVVRWENGVVVRVEEAGEAFEENGVFVARPIAERLALPEIAVARVSELAASFGPAERIIVAEGVAVHECDGIRWSEETRRVHVALTKKPWRVLVDDAEAVPRVVRALAQCEGAKRFERVRLAPHVSAALMPQLSCAREQMPGERDGNGRPIERRGLEGAPPNVYRPSYRLRPVAAWFNVRAIPFGTIDTSAPEAIAIVDAAQPAVLVEEGERVFVTTVDVARVTAVGETGKWYPFGPGSFGAEIIL